MDLTKQFFKYVSQNIFGLLGTSCYILADTYFIAQAAGTDGVTLLNLCLPIYNFIFAIGSMIALGSATRYAIAKAQNDARGQRYFSNAILCAVLASIPWMLAGAFAPGTLLRFMGGDAGIVALGIPYARIFLLFTPFFMCNYIVSAFVRNDGDPSLAMVATLSGSLFNVVFDYIFMFPLGLGLAGAALATAVSPIISIAICGRHFFKKENTLQFVRQMPSARLLGQSCQLGISGFVGELSSGVTTTVFNFLLLGLAGNVGVAAYGVVANFALVATAIFNGVAQGAQPLVSRCYGQNDHAGARKLLLLGSGTVLVLAAVLYAVNAPVSKLLLRQVPATVMAALLYLGAGAGVFLMGTVQRFTGRKREERPLTRRELPYTVGMVALDIAAPIFLMVGLTRTTAANASLLNNFEIVATAITALMVFREAISKRLWLAIALVTASSMLLSFEDMSSLSFSWGSLLVLLACVCWGFENNCTRMLSSKDPMEIVVIKGFGSGLGSLATVRIQG